MGMYYLFTACGVVASLLVSAEWVSSKASGWKRATWGVHVRLLLHEFL